MNICSLKVNRKLLSFIPKHLDKQVVSAIDNCNKLYLLDLGVQESSLNTK